MSDKYEERNVETTCTTTIVSDVNIVHVIRYALNVFVGELKMFSPLPILCVLFSVSVCCMYLFNKWKRLFDLQLYI